MNSSHAKSYLFIDNTRFLAILAIVMRHTELFETEQGSLSTFEDCIMQFRGFGVVLLFVISGFLMAAWLARPGATRGGYWSGRLSLVGRPWLVWTALYCGLDNAKLWLLHRLHQGEFLANLWNSIFVRSAYWYVPIFLATAAVLLLLRPWWARPGPC